MNNQEMKDQILINKSQALMWGLLGLGMTGGTIASLVNLDPKMIAICGVATAICAGIAGQNLYEIKQMQNKMNQKQK